MYHGPKLLATPERIEPGMTNLIFGCGYLGRRVAQLWLQQGQATAAITRGRGDQLRQLGVEPIAGDVRDSASLGALPEADTVLYAIGMDRSSGHSFHDVYVEGLRNALDALPACRRFIYVSSTSVYGQSHSEDVDESSPTEPREGNGQVVLEAERLLRHKLPGAIILRFAGIYGPNRGIRRASVEKGEALICDPDKWLNLIHVDDGARAVLAAAARGRKGETYLIADDCPVRRRDFYTCMAELLGAPPPRFELPSADAMLREGGNRRAVNRKMRTQLGVDLLYPDYRSGLRAGC
jgi:nucleoside-diphosphate-sugar epimerase